MARTWLITGTTSGFGQEFTLAALDRGDRVAATARHPEKLAPLIKRYGDSVFPVELDVTDRTQVLDAVRRASHHLGGLDIVVNNAGYGHLGMVEELSEQDVRDELETNFFGALWVTQAALPIMRSRGGGRILQVTSEGGVRAFPQFGAYHASKWALEGLSQSLAWEVRPFGIRITMVEPGPYATGFGSSGLRQSDQLDAYDQVRSEAADERATWARGTPSATRGPLLEIVDSEDPPLRVFFGHSLDSVETEYRQRLDEWRCWRRMALRAFGEPADSQTRPLTS